MSNRSLKASEQAYWKSYKEEKAKKQKLKESDAKKQQKAENEQRLATKKRKVAQELETTGKKLNSLEQKKKRLDSAVTNVHANFEIDRASEPSQNDMLREREHLNRLHWKHQETQQQVSYLKEALHHSDSSTRIKPSHANAGQARAEDAKELSLLEDMLFGGDQGSSLPSLDMRDVAMRQTKRGKGRDNGSTKFLKTVASDDTSEEDESKLRPVSELQPAWIDGDEQELEDHLRAMKIKDEEQKNNWLKLYTPEEINIVAQTVTRVVTEMIPPRRLITRSEFINVPNLMKDLQQSTGWKWKRVPYRITETKFHPNAEIYVTTFLGNIYINDIASLFKKKSLASLTKSTQPEDKTGRFQEQQAQSNLSVTGFVDQIQIYNPHGLPNGFQFTCLDFTPDGTGLFVGGTSGLFYVELATKKYTFVRTGLVGIATVAKEHFAVKKLLVSPDGKYVAVSLQYQNKIHIVCVDSKRTLHEIHQGPLVNDLAFSPDSNYLHAAADDGAVYCYSVKDQWELFRKNVDVGSLRVTAIAFSPNGFYYIVGNDSGIVNVYQTQQGGLQPPTLLKTIYNLKDCIIGLTVNPSSQLLSILSHESSRMYHLASLTCYEKFDRRCVLRNNERIGRYHGFSSDSQYYFVSQDCSICFHHLPFYAQNT